MSELSGRKSGVDFRYSCSRCRVLMSGVDVGRRCQVLTSGDDVGRPTWCQTRCRCRDLRSASQESDVGDFWKVFPVLIDYPELQLTRCTQYENRDSDWQCALPFIRFLAGRRGCRDLRRQERREAELYPV